jgi:hypothetical protein
LILPPVASIAHGVGNVRTNVSSDLSVCVAELRSYGRLVVYPLLTVGVGTSFSDDPNPLASMRRANGGRSQHSPFSIVPERGQVTEDDTESANSESWGVFHEDEAGLYLANDPRHLSPEPRPLAVEACARAGDADILAREAARNDVNNASPRSAVKS